MEAEFCENCEEKIGKLEQAFVYKSHIVCKKFYNKLTKKVEESPDTPKNTTKKITKKPQTIEQTGKQWKGLKLAGPFHISGSRRSLLPRIALTAHFPA